MRGLRNTLSLNKGLRPNQGVPRNSLWASELRGARVAEYGLELFDAIVDPLLSDITLSWPLPQLVVLRDEILLLDETRIWSVNADWSKTSKLSLAVAGSTWHCADFGPWMVLANGSKVYERNATSGAFSESTMPTCLTVCRFRGRVMGGNVTSSWYDADSRFALWSAIGESTYEPDWKNEAGYRDMEIGAIKRCLPLSDQAVVYYGDEGIAMLMPQSRSPVLGWRRLASFGVPSRDAVAGESTHLCVSHEGRVYRVTAEGVEQLGYKEFMDELTLSSLVMSYDPLRGDYYFSDGSRCFVMTSNGMSEHTVTVSALGRYDGNLLGVGAAYSDQTFALSLGLVDFNLITQKLLGAAEVGFNSDADLYAAVDWHNEASSPFITSTWKRVTGLGFVHIGVSCKEFRLRFKTTQVPTSLNLDYATIGFKLTDNRVQNQLQTISSGGWHVG